MSIHHARTPTRIDLAGGWTDVPRFAEEVPGAVLNYAITLYSHVRVEDVEGDRVMLRSLDFDETAHMPVGQAIADADLTGPFGLVKAALRRRPARSGVSILSRSEAPPGSGLGTSAAMGVALVGALGRATGVPDDTKATAETAVALETEELRILSGKQDHYASTLGGAQFMTFDGPDVTTTRLPLSPEATAELRRRVVLVARRSGTRRSGTARTTRAPSIRPRAPPPRRPPRTTRRARSWRGSSGWQCRERRSPRPSPDLVLK